MIGHDFPLLRVGHRIRLALQNLLGIHRLQQFERYVDDENIQKHQSGGVIVAHKAKQNLGKFPKQCVLQRFIVRWDQVPESSVLTLATVVGTFEPLGKVSRGNLFGHAPQELLDDGENEAVCEQLSPLRAKMAKSQAIHDMHVKNDHLDDELFGTAISAKVNVKAFPQVLHDKRRGLSCASYQGLA
jgi:hypothetical protein